MIENLVRDIEDARIQALQNVNNYFDQLIEDAKVQAEKMELEMVSCRQYKDLEAQVDRDKVKLDTDIAKLDGGNYVGVLQEYDSREPNKKFDHTSLAVSEFLRNMKRPKLILNVDKTAFKNFPDNNLKTAIYVTNPNAGKHPPISQFKQFRIQRSTILDSATEHLHSANYSNYSELQER